jgi:urease accessory protein
MATTIITGTTMGTTMGTMSAAAAITTTMAEALDAAALYRLQTWLSPAYPVGAYTYSHGLETAVEDGLVRDRAGLARYIATALEAGAGRVDGALLAAAWRAAVAGDDRALDEVALLATAWRGSAELALETMQQGTAFTSVTQAAWPHAGFAAFAARHPRRLAHPVAFGAAAGFATIPLRPALAAWLAGFAANLVSAGVRLVPLGQTDGQLTTAALFGAVEAATEAALVADLDRLGTAAPLLDLLSMRHETQYTRLFRS